MSLRAPKSDAHANVERPHSGRGRSGGNRSATKCCFAGLVEAVVPGAAISAESQGEAREGTAFGPARVHALSRDRLLPFRIGRRPRYPVGGDWRLHVKLSIHWSPANVQRVLALVDTGADCSLLCGNPELSPGPVVHIDG